MNKHKNNSTDARALHVALSIALLCIAAVLLAASFNTTPVTRGLSAATANTNTPVLVVTTDSNPFSKYYSEILKAEGLNAFQTARRGRLNGCNRSRWKFRSRLYFLGRRRLPVAVQLVLQ